MQINLGNGDGTFQFGPYYQTGPLTSLVTRDFNGDGKLDLAIPGATLFGHGDGSFQNPVSYHLSFPNPTFVAVRDLNRDGHADLVVAYGASEPFVSVMLGNPDGSFQPESLYSTGAGVQALAAGDFHGGGKLDLAAALIGNALLILKGNGNGTFEQTARFPDPIATPAAAAVADCNGDGNPDLVVGGDAGLSVLLGTGRATFAATSSIALSLRGNLTALLAADFNGDGKVDLLAASETTNQFHSHPHGEVLVLLGNGDGNFQPPLTTSLPAGADSVVAGDFNGDGKLDLAIVNGYAGTYSILPGNGDGTFQSAASYRLGAASVHAYVTVGDFNGDGKPDLAVACGTVIILLGNGDGTFRPLPGIVAGSNMLETVAAADFNGDGRFDLAVTHGGDSNLSILLGNGDGTFQPAVAYNAQGSSIAIGDFNGDGKLDLALTGAFKPIPGVYLGNVPILLGNGDGTFRPGPIYLGGESAPKVIVAADFNRDGRPDLAIADHNSVALLTNTAKAKP